MISQRSLEARNITGLATETRVKDAAGNVKARTQIAYDEGAYSPIAAGTHPQWEDPNTAYRGSPTTTRSWHDIAANQYVETHAQYDNSATWRRYSVSGLRFCDFRPRVNCREVQNYLANHASWY